MATTRNESQLTDTVLMVRPKRFTSNPQTAASNRFQQAPDISDERLQARALDEFEGFVAALRGAGIEVIVFDDTAEPHTPDAVFPNNWVSFHADGRAVLYPMEAGNRRLERRPDIIAALAEQHGFAVSEVIDLATHEADGHFLEGTGSLVLDRVNRIAYACLSSRTHLEPLGDFAQRMDYEVVAFEAVDANGTPVYHTNVMMSIGEELAFVCDGAIGDADQRRAVLAKLSESGREAISLSYAQLSAFAGNMLEVRGTGGKRQLVMSTQAYRALDAAQARRVIANGSVVAAPLDTIEAAAGGSARCMLAEVHLPRSGKMNDPGDQRDNSHA